MDKEGRVRAVVDAVLPAIDGGRFRAKCIAGEPMHFEAHCFTDGHDKIAVVLSWQAVGAKETYEVEMAGQANDVWTAQFIPPVPGRYRYTVSAWVDHFESWRRSWSAAMNLPTSGSPCRWAPVSLMTSDPCQPGGCGAAVELGRAAARDGAGPERIPDVAAMQGLGLDAAKAAIMKRYADRRFAASRTLELVADRKRAQFSSWYELFPRLAASEHGAHGTFRDVQARLPYMARMGFDVLYLPPIHPIGRVNRKGANNALNSGPRMSAVPGRSAPHREATRTSCRNWARSRTSRRCCARHAKSWHRDSAGFLHSSARPITRTCTSIPNGSTIGPMARSICRKSAEEIPGHLSG